MEFTPKKQIIPSFSNRRHTPYTNSGQTQCNRFKKRINQSGPPWPSYRRNSPQTYSQKRFLSRSERIVNLSTRNLPAGEEVTASHEKIKKGTPSPKSAKRPLSVVNIAESVNDQVFPSSPTDREADSHDAKKKHSHENDPYNFSSNNDHEICDKRAKIDVDKENNFNTPSRTTIVKSYPSKKKIESSRSRLLADISPEKVEKAYGASYQAEEEKENVPAETTSDGELVPLPEPAITLPHLIGFPNYGNTCYLNSVVQALFGLSPFLGDLELVSSQHTLPATSLSSGLNQVIGARTKGQVALVKQSLKTVKENLVRVDGSFSGYKMQDANEFLTRILDTIKDEIDRCYMTTPSPDRCLTARDEDDELFPHSTRFQKVNTVEKIFEDEISTPTKDKSEISTPNKDKSEISTPNKNKSEISTPNNDKSEISTPTEDSPTVNSKDSDDEQLTQVFEGEETTTSVKVVSSEAESEDEPLPPCPTESFTPNTGCDEDALPRNPIKDNFEFQLFESYRCLGCHEVVGKKQEYFGLYVNLPEEDHDNIQAALSSCMGEDERDLKCEKCGHNRSSVVTTVTRLPRILIVQLKRYEYKAEQGESIKRSWKVPVNRWLTLDAYVTQDVSEPSSWSPHSGSVVPRANKQTTLTVRNLSSELNVCEGRKEAGGSKEQEEPSVCSPGPGLLKTPENAEPPAASDKEDEELQEVMRRSMEDIGGTREEDEIQQAIRLSLQDLGMSYAPENQIQTSDEQDEEESVNKAQTVEDEQGEDEISKHRHAFHLISVISHFGCTTNTGHYVADVYNCEEKSWFHYDDETVSKIPESIVFAEGRQKNGYIFFYVHKDIFQKIEKRASQHR